MNRSPEDEVRAPADSALALSEARFKSAFRSAAIGKAIVGPDLRFQEVNAAYCRMVGYSEAELLAMGPADLRHPDDSGEGEHLMRRLLDGSVESGHARKRYLHRDGTSVWGDQTLTLVRDAAGRPAYFLGEVVDVTERKRTEDALALSEARFRSAFANAGIGKAIATPQLRFIEVNRALCEMLGYTERELLALSPVEITPPEDFPMGAMTLQRLMSGEATTSRMLKRYIRKDGSIMWGDLTFTLMRDAAGLPSFFMAEVVDVTERRTAERLLKEREANLAEAQRLAHVGSWEWDLASGEVKWSEELYRILGVQPEPNAASYDLALERLHPDDRARTAEVMDRAMLDGSPFEIENRTLREDGSVQVLWTSGRADLDEDGKPTRLYGATQDITERKLFEQSLRNSEKRFRDLYTLAPVMMTSSGGDGRVREVSNYWLATMGYARHEVVGRDGQEFLTEESRLTLSREFEAARARGESVLRNTPLVGVRKDGSTLDVLATSVLDLDETGGLQGVITVGIDVTDLRRAEEAMRESEARYRALVEHAPEAIAVLDVADGRFVDTNSEVERLFGVRREQILGLGPLDFAPPTQPDGRLSRDVAAAQIARARAGESPIFEFVCRDSSGREFPCQIRLSRLPAKDRELIRSSIHDISELKLLEEKVRHGDKMAAIGVLAAGVAHEVGNPLMALSMAVQSLQRRSADDYAQKKLTLIREHIERISHIVRQMSDLARPRVATRTNCDVNRVVERSLEVVRYDRRAKQVEIQFEPDAGLPRIDAVEDQLVQVCLNLCLNALDAVADNPPGVARRLRIHTTRLHAPGSRSGVRVTFHDSGPGIPMASRARLFQPFFTTKAPGKGTGLGLSVSRRIIEEHSGRLAFDCDSAPGTQFYFELPIEEGA